MSAEIRGDIVTPEALAANRLAAVLRPRVEASTTMKSEHVVRFDFDLTITIPTLPSKALLVLLQQIVEAGTKELAAELTATINNPPRRVRDNDPHYSPPYENDPLT